MAKPKDSMHMAMEEMRNEGPGKIDYDPQVLRTIVVEEAKNIEGIYLPGKSNKSWIGGSKKDQPIDYDTAVEIIPDEKNTNHVQVKITIIVAYGLNVLDTSRTLQRRTKNALEDMTGVLVDAVPVFVKDLQLPEVIEEAEPALLEASIVDEEEKSEEAS